MPSSQCVLKETGNPRLTGHNFPDHSLKPAGFSCFQIKKLLYPRKVYFNYQEKVSVANA